MPDNLGNPTPSINPDELKNLMLQSTASTAVGIQEILSKFNEIIKEQKENNKKVSAVINKINSSFGKKIENLNKTIEAFAKASQKLDKQIKEQRKKEANSGLNEKTLKRVLSQVFNHKKEVNDLNKNTKGKNIFTQDMTVHNDLNILIRHTAKMEAAISRLTAAATKKGSIYTHDEHLAKSLKKARVPLEDMPVEEAKAAVAGKGKRKKSGKSTGAEMSFEERMWRKLLNDQKMSLMLENEHDTLKEQTFKNALKEEGFSKKRLELLYKLMDVSDKLDKDQAKRIVHAKEDVANSIHGTQERKDALENLEKLLENELVITEKRIKLEMREPALLERNAKALQESVEIVNKQIFGINTWETMTKGIVENQREYIKEITYTAFQQGAVSSQLQHQDYLEGSIFNWNKARARTGKNLAELQKSYNKTLRAGIKDQKVAIDIATKGLSLSTAIGSKSEETVEMFKQWNTELGLSTEEMGRLSMGVKSAGQLSGLFGDDLMRAVKSTEHLMKNMRNIGTLTAEAASQMVKMTASAQKFGVGEEFAQFADALTGGLSNWEKLSPTLKNLTAQIAVLKGVDYSKIIFGTATPAEMKSVLSGFKDIYETAKGMSPQNQQIFLKQFGLNIGQFRQLAKAYDESQKTYLQRLEEFQKKKDSSDYKNFTNLEKANLNWQMTSLKFAEAAELSAMKPEELKKAQERLKGVGIGNLTGGAGTQQELIQAMRKSLDESLKQVAAGGGRVSNIEKINEETYRKALAGDEKSIASFKEQAQTMNETISNEFQRLKDPFTRLESTLTDIHDLLQSTFGGFIGKLATFFAPFAALVAIAASILKAGFGTWSVLRDSRAVLKTSQTKLEKTRSILHTMEKAMLHKGSIYTHDYHVVKAIYDTAGRTSGGGFGGGTRRGRLGRRRKGFGGGRRRGGRGRLAGGLAALGFMADLGIDNPLLDLADMGLSTADIAGDINELATLGQGGATAAKGGGFLSRIGGKTGGFLGKAGGLLGKVGGKIAPFLGPLLGGITGFAGAEAAGRGKLEGTILGALTGGADTGSVIGGMLGLGGTATDEALGIAGAAGTGALTGAAIGSVVPVVGTAIGAAIGGVIGGGAELYKIFTKKNSPLRKKLAGWGSALWQGTKNAGSWLWDKTKNIGSTLWGGAEKLLSWEMDMYKWTFAKAGEISGTLWNGTKKIAGYIWDGLKNIFPGGLSKIFEKGWEVAKQIGSKLLDFVKSIPELIIRYTIPGGDWIVNKIKNNIQPAGVNPVNPVQQQRATNVNTNTQGDIVANTENIDENTKVSADQLKILVTKIDTLINLMSNSVRNNQVANNVGSGAYVIPDYHTMNFGNYSGNASKGPIV